LEAASLGVIGAALGAVLSVALILTFNAVGFTWTPPGAAIPQAIRLGLSARVIIMPILTILVSTLLSALFPSWRNSRIEIVRALQSV
jgi:ABC-type lipoprotein release transport system permease subunit